MQDITAIKHSEDEIRIAATAFESQEGMIITDAGQRILRVNAAFTRISGYNLEDVSGRTPALFKSGRHDQAFYQAMWESIAAKGSWQGEIWNRRKNAEVFPEWLTITAVKNSSGRITHYVGALTDITLRKSAEDEIRNLAFYDPLTRLPNRRLLLDRLHQALASSARSGRQGALLFLDLDHFKTLNDTLGHDIGDLLLQHTAQRLATCIREGDTVARFGGDEFVVMLVDLSTIHEQSLVQAETIGEKILTALSQPYDLSGHEYRNTASVEGGVAGAGGFVLAAADFPALMAIKVRMLADIVAAYGWGGRSLRERLFVLHIFHLAFASARRRPEALADLERWIADIDQPQAITDYDWRTFQIEYRDHIDLAKMAQLIPVVGAPIGAVVNWRLVERLGETAIMACRMRWMAEAGR